MTIEKGSPYGAPGTLPADGVVVRSDESARQVVEAARRAGEPIPPLGLLGGDLWRTLGGHPGGGEERLRSGDAVTFPVDVGAVLIDGRLHWFVAHLMARNQWWTQAFVAMNAQWYERWNLGPRAHPNDGLLDTFDARLRPTELLKVRSRVRMGAHLPHPGIKERRTASIQVQFERPRDVVLDGTWAGRARNLSMRIEPDAMQVVV